MLKLINILAVIPALWRFARDMARALEETIPEDGYGNEKIAAVDKVLRTAIKISDDTDDNAEEKLSALGTSITQSAVTLMKASGELQAIKEQAQEELKKVASETEEVISVAIDEANNATGS